MTKIMTPVAALVTSQVNIVCLNCASCGFCFLIGQFNDLVITEAVI